MIISIELERFRISAKACKITSGVLQKEIEPVVAVNFKNSKMLDLIQIGDLIACVNEDEYGFYIDLNHKIFQSIKQNYGEDKNGFIESVSDDLIGSIVRKINSNEY